VTSDQEPRIRAGTVLIGDDVEFGPGVVIEAEQVVIGAGSRIGMSDDDDFRTPPGVVIRARSLVLGERVGIGRAVRMDGGDLVLDDAVRILRNSTIRVVDRLRIGAHGTVNESCEIGGRQVEIGQELWMLPTAKIGGGSAYEVPSRLEIGHYAHLGMQTLVNTARPVVIGHEVGLGTRTAIYTHGAYPSRLQGFPVAFEGVEIGDFTWIPGATINPGVRIGRNVVVGVNSLVTSSVPDGALAIGSPAKVIREGAFPRPLDEAGRSTFYRQFLERYATLIGSAAGVVAGPDGTLVLDAGEVVFAATTGDDGASAVAALGGSGRLDGRRTVLVGMGAGSGDSTETWTTLDPASRRIGGPADRHSERFVNELRRYGVRFYSRPRGDAYVDWLAEPPSFSGAPIARSTRDGDSSMSDLTSAR